MLLRNSSYNKKMPTERANLLDSIGLCLIGPGTNPADVDGFELEIGVRIILSAIANLSLI